MADVVTAPDQDQALANEELRQRAIMARPFQAASLPAVAPPTPTSAQATPTPAPAPAVTVARPASASPSATSLPPIGGTADLESHIGINPAARAGEERRGIAAPSDASARRDLDSQSFGAGAPAPKPLSREEQAVQDAQDRLDAIQDKQSGLAHVIPITQGEGFGHSLLRGVEHFGRGVATGAEVAGNILAPKVMANIPGTNLNKTIQAGQAEGQLTNAENNAHVAAETEAQKATAQQKGSMNQQQIAAREKGFDLTQDPVTGKWEMTPLPTNMLSAEQQSKINKEGEPKTEIKISPADGKVFQFITDTKGNTTSKPVLDANGQQVVDSPKAEYEYKTGAAPDGTEHNYAYNKSDPTKKIDLGPSQPTIQSKPDVFGNSVGAADDTPKTLAAREKTFTKDYVDPLQKTEGTFSQFSRVLSDINAGKDLTGADSVVTLFNAIGISATPMKGMGFRINSNVIEEHANARGLGESLYQKLLKLQSGAVITPQQIRDYAMIAQSTRHDAYVNAANEAIRENLPVDFLPKGNNKKLDPATAQIYRDVAGGDFQKAANAAAANGWKF